MLPKNYQVKLLDRMTGDSTGEKMILTEKS